MSNAVRKNVFRIIAVEALFYNLAGLIILISASVNFQGVSIRAELNGPSGSDEVTDHNKRRLKNGEFGVRLKYEQL